MKNIFLVKAKNIINLVIHRKAIERIVNYSDPLIYNREYARDQNVLKEIDKVARLPNTIFFEGYMKDELIRKVGNAEYVILYGCNRGACLNWVTEELTKHGISVAWNIRGTI